MNHTKWSEARLAMLALGDLSPQWRNRVLNSGYVGRWDGEWFHHFYDNDYSLVEWVEMRCETDAQMAAVLQALREVHVPGEVEGPIVRVFGHIAAGRRVDYL